MRVEPQDCLQNFEFFEMAKKLFRRGIWIRKRPSITPDLIEVLPVPRVSLARIACWA